MALSPHQELADELVALIDAWGSKPADVTVERAYSVEQFVGGWADDAPARIVCLVSSIDGLRIGRNQDQDDVIVSVVYLRKLADMELATNDAADIEADALRTFLRSAAVERITLPTINRAASRVNTGLPTPYAADLIRNNEIFCSVIAATYRILRDQ